MPHVTSIPIEQIRIDPTRMPIRRLVSEEGVARIARQLGIDPWSVPPITVWPDPGESDLWFLISGLHRLEAHRRVGDAQIPSVILDRSEEAATGVALAELTRPGRRAAAWDMSHAIGVVHERLGRPSVRDLAEQVGRGRTQTHRLLRVSQELPEREVVAALSAEGLEPTALGAVSLDRLYEVARAETTTLEERIELLASLLRPEKQADDQLAVWALRGRRWARIAAVPALLAVAGGLVTILRWI